MKNYKGLVKWFNDKGEMMGSLETTSKEETLRIASALVGSAVKIEESFSL